MHNNMSQINQNTFAVYLTVSHLILTYFFQKTYKASVFRISRDNIRFQSTKPLWVNYNIAIRIDLFQKCFHMRTYSFDIFGKIA